MHNLMLISVLPMLASVNSNDLFRALLWIVGLGLITWVLWWFIGYVGLPEPFNKVARVLVALVAIIVLIKIIIQICGSPF